MQFEATQYFIDVLLFGPERNADDDEFFLLPGSHHCPVVVVVVRLKEIFGENREAHLTIERSLVDRLHLLGAGMKDENRLPEHRQVSVPRPIFVWFADNPFDCACNAADRKRRNIQLLPCLQIFAHNDCYFCIELHTFLLSFYSLLFALGNEQSLSRAGYQSALVREVGGGQPCPFRLQRRTRIYADPLADGRAQAMERQFGRNKLP